MHEREIVLTCAQLGSVFVENCRAGKVDKIHEADIRVLETCFNAIPTLIDFNTELQQSLADQQTHTAKIEEELAALIEANRWIPIEEDLPEDMKTVFVVIYGTTIMMAFIDKGYWNIADRDGDTLLNVTHWREKSEELLLSTGE